MYQPLWDKLFEKYVSKDKGQLKSDIPTQEKKRNEQKNRPSIRSLCKSTRKQSSSILNSCSQRQEVSTDKVM